MTNKEMSELFAIMMLAWPNAEMFKGGTAKLAPTIKLWTTCLPEIDFWTGQQALIKLCRVCKFPPTIAEFKEQADIFDQEIKSAVSQIQTNIRNADYFGGSLEAWYAELPPGCPEKLVIARMGGPQELIEIHTGGDGKQFSMWRWDRLEAEYRSLLRERKTLPGGSVAALPARKEV